MTYKLTKNLIEPVFGEQTLEEYKAAYRGYQIRKEFISNEGILTFVPGDIREDWNSEVEEMVKSELAKNKAAA